MKRSVPDNSLLAEYQSRGGYTDCYVVDVGISISLSEFVAAFYTTPLFKLERWILRFAISRPSSDEQAVLLGQGVLQHFSAWTVEARRENEILLCDLNGRTRSWLMVESIKGMQLETSRLYFGSAVVPYPSSRSEGPRLGFVFSALLGFHKLYSRALLISARKRLLATFS